MRNHQHLARRRGRGFAAIILTLVPLLVMTSLSVLPACGWMATGWGDQAYPIAPAPYDSKFPEGIQAGTHPYRIIDTVSFDDLGLPPPGARFDLNVCAPPCNPPVPNLT